jgi:hypothetical protein
MYMESGFDQKTVSKSLPLCLVLQLAVKRPSVNETLRVMAGQVRHKNTFVNSFAGRVWVV